MFNLRGERFKGTSQAISSQRVLHIWNELSEKVGEVGITTFKTYLDRYVDSKGLEGCEPNGTNLNGHLGQHGRVWSNGLYPCCITLLIKILSICLMFPLIY